MGLRPHLIQTRSSGCQMLITTYWSSYPKLSTCYQPPLKNVLYGKNVIMFLRNCPVSTLILLICSRDALILPAETTHPSLHSSVRQHLFFCSLSSCLCALIVCLLCFTIVTEQLVTSAFYKMRQKIVTTNTV